MDNVFIQLLATRHGARVLSRLTCDGLEEAVQDALSDGQTFDRGITKINDQESDPICGAVSEWIGTCG